MEMLAFYIPGLCFHPLHFHCLLSITVLPAFIQYLQPECLFVTTSRGYFTVYLSVITSLLKTLSRDPLLSHWRPMWFAFPFQLFVLNHLLGEPYTPPELNTCSLPNTTFLWPFWFYTCCSIHLSYLPSNSSSENVVVFQGSAQICFCYEDTIPLCTGWHSSSPTNPHLDIKTNWPLCFVYAVTRALLSKHFSNTKIMLLSLTGIAKKYSWKVLLEEGIYLISHLLRRKRLPVWF